MKNMILSILRGMLKRLVGNVRQVLTIHLIYILLGTIIFTPLLGIVGRGILKLSGQATLSDFDILYFFLTPMGMVATIFFGALLISILVFEQASLMAISGGIHDRHVAVVTALAFTVARAKPIFFFAIGLVVRLLVIVLPFLAVSGGIGWLLLNDYDINYYLAEKPPVFWGAVAAIGMILLVMTFVLVRKLLGWSMTLPLVLFSGVVPGRSFVESENLVHGDRRLILILFGFWAAVTVVLGMVLLGCVQFLGSVLVPFFYDSIAILVIILGVIVALWSLGNFFVTACNAGSFGCLLLALSAKYGLKCDLGEYSKNGQEKFVKFSLSRLVCILAGVVVITLISGFWLLNGVQVQDNAVIIAHRGAAGRAPENTLASVRAAIEDQTDWIEIDVQESMDGEIVVVHDSDLMKIAGADMKIWNTTLEDLRQVDIGGWFGETFSSERIPTLTEVLEEVRGKAHLLVELKYYGHDQQLEQRVIDIVEQAEMVDQVAFMSLKLDGIEKLRGLRPDWNVGLLLSKSIGNLSNMEMAFLAVNMATTSPGFIRRAHGAGKKVFVWTVNERISMSRMMSLGVDGIITDEPALAREVLNDRLQLNSIERLLIHTAILLGQPVPGKTYRDQSP